ncbi:hypothetical protein [Mycetocola zhujimingii]|nr:hypothetical protein [Mycetocola zhujimingii]
MTSETMRHRPRRGIADWLDPGRAFWLGIVLILVGVYGSWALTVAGGSQGGQELWVSWPVMSLLALLGSSVALGAGFLVAAVVARGVPAPAHVSLGTEEGTRDERDESRIPPRLSPRVSVLLGLVLILIGVVNQNVYFIQFVPDNPGVERDILSVVLLLVPALPAIGCALVPGGWLLARFAALSR